MMKVAFVFGGLLATVVATITSIGTAHAGPVVPNAVALVEAEDVPLSLIPISVQNGPNFGPLELVQVPFGTYSGSRFRGTATG
jgi:hypothetical protein